MVPETGQSVIGLTLIQKPNPTNPNWPTKKIERKYLPAETNPKPC